MSNDAEKMNNELLALVQGHIPDTREWQTEIPNDMHLGGSRNKPLVCATAEAYFAFYKGNSARVDAMLDWWLEFCLMPLSDGEELTPEEVYRPMMVYSAFAAGALARRIGHPAMAPCLAYARAHVAWLALGAGAGAGRKVVDHHLDNVNGPCVLIGNSSKFASHLQYIAQPGMRGWIRNRDGGPKTFHFTESVGLSVIVAQAAGSGYERKPTPWQHDLFRAVLEFSPGVTPLGFTPADVSALLSYLADPASYEKALKIVDMVRAYAPDVDFEFVRYVDGSIVVYMLKNHGSSTDDRMVDAWFAGGYTYKASADDGNRDEHLAMTAHEAGGAVVVEGGGHTVTVAMPTAEISYRVSVRGRVVTPKNMRAPDAPPPVIPVDPTRPSTQKGKKRWL